MGEYELLLAEENNLIKASVLRLHNVYGPPCETDEKYSITCLVKKLSNILLNPLLYGDWPKEELRIYIRYRCINFINEFWF